MNCKNIKIEHDPYISIYFKIQRILFIFVIIDHSYTHRRTHAHTHLRTQTHAHTHTLLHTHPHTPTHTHTHTLTRLYSGYADIPPCVKAVEEEL